MGTYIKGYYRKSIYKNDQTGYIIGLFKVIDTDDVNLEQYLDKTILKFLNKHSLYLL